MAASPVFVEDRAEVGWRGFTPGMWKRSVNVREFIQRNYTPYEGDQTFLQGPTPRTLGIWKTLQPLFAQEREKGILDVDQVPSSILAHDYRKNPLRRCRRETVLKRESRQCHIIEYESARVALAAPQLRCPTG